MKKTLLLLLAASSVLFGCATFQDNMNKISDADLIQYASERVKIPVAELTLLDRSRIPTEALYVLKDSKNTEIKCQGIPKRDIGNPTGTTFSYVTCIMNGYSF